jgi:hypothetical protein
MRSLSYWPSPASSREGTVRQSLKFPPPAHNICNRSRKIDGLERSIRFLPGCPSFRPCIIRGEASGLCLVGYCNYTLSEGYIRTGSLTKYHA